MGRPQISRRVMLKLTLGGVAAVAGTGALSTLTRRGDGILDAAAPPPTPKYFLAGTDGWISLPGAPLPPYYPDTLAPSGKSTYVFGFADATAAGGATRLVNTNVRALKNKAQAMAPIMYFEENVPAVIRMTNLGLQQRPDLVDSHTIHWHGFRNQIPMFDGEPTSSVAVPVSRVMDYYYLPRQAGTYMYHCHFEDTEHVHMGMTGIVFVLAAQNKTGNGAGAPIARSNGGAALAPLGYAYNDGVALNDPRSTAYDREFVMFLSEVWNESHWDDAHIQLPDWTDYKPDFYLLNGRSYPDTLAPAGGTFDAVGQLVPPAGRPDLVSQPYSSLIKCNSGERVLLRFANLGYTKQSMTLGGIQLKVVGQDAIQLKGRDGTDISFATNTISIGPGESYDAIFTAPTVSVETTFLLYNRNYDRLSNGGTGAGGQMTEIHVFPAGTIAAQTAPHTNP